jgi:exodeoxyribonuclease X
VDQAVFASRNRIGEIGEKMRVATIDTETTGMSDDDCVVELAFVEDMLDGRHTYRSSLVIPVKQISFEAMAIHHITPEMVEDAPSIGELIFSTRLNDISIFAAHNAKFDRHYLPMLNGAEKQWICTMRCALHLWPDAPGHSNQVLRYWLNLDVSDMPSTAGATPHRALYDAWTTQKLLEAEIAVIIGDNNLGITRDMAIKKLIEMSDQPVVLRKVRFGKFEGRTWDQVPPDYLGWVIKQSSMDPDVLHTARHYLNNR